jgi:hypothetical protein
VQAVGSNIYMLISVFLKSVCVGWVTGFISLDSNNIQKFKIGLQVTIFFVCLFVLFLVCDLHLQYLDWQTVLNCYIL